MEGGVEPFDEGGINHAFSILRYFDQTLEDFLAALHNALINRKYAFVALLADLHDGDRLPGEKFTMACFPSPAR